MDENKSAIEYKEGQTTLFESSYRAVYFNIIMASMLSASLLYNGLPGTIVISWLVAIILITLIRTVHCKITLKFDLLEKAARTHLKIFLILTAIAGLLWTSIYFALLHDAGKLQLYLILLVCGGMAAGSTASLGIYSPAFFAYICAIFVPIIIYNYTLWDVNDAIFASMFVMFLIAISIIARSHQRLFAHIFFLTEQNKKLLKEFEKLSITDPLTGLYNRRYFNQVFPEEYRRAKRNQHGFALMSIDVDNFKLVNDNLGHPFGDQLLVYLSEYLQGKLKRANDIIFRIGGDEFVALLINITEENAQLICDRVAKAFLREPVFVYKEHGNLYKDVLDQVSISIGVIYVSYESTATIEQIIALADMTLYAAKHEGKHQINYMRCM